MATEMEMEDYLINLLVECDTNIEKVITFEEKQLLTGNRGVVVRFGSGDVFHLTIVQESSSGEELVWREGYDD